MRTGEWMASAAAVLLLAGSLAGAPAKAGASDGKKGQGQQKKAAKELRPADAEKKTESPAPAKGIWTPPDLTEQEKAEWKDGRPPGWSRGKKTGWKGGSLPPGLAKKQQGTAVEAAKPPKWESWPKSEQIAWDSALERIRERIRRRAEGTRGETMIFSVESAARAGVPLRQLDQVTDRSIRSKLSDADFEKVTRALSYGVNREADFPRIADRLNSRITAGTRGDDLAVGVYREIAERRAARTTK